jgi:HPt (histidine-containing phosphotransfer) domain-containing protein
MSGEDLKQLDHEVIAMLQEAIGASVKRIIVLYLEDFPNNIQQMRQALQAQDLTTVAMLAHSVKSSSANLGAMQTSQLATQLESLINNGETKSATIDAAIDGLSLSFDQVRPMFNEYL